MGICITASPDIKYHSIQNIKTCTR